MNARLPLEFIQKLKYTCSAGQWVRMYRYTVYALLYQRFVRFWIHRQLLQFIQGIEAIDYTSCEIEINFIWSKEKGNEDIARHRSHRTKCI